MSDYEKKRDEAAMECMNKYNEAALTGALVLAPVFSGFCNGSDWGSDWAREALLSYIPKVPTEPYEKSMAKEILKLKRRIKELEDAASAK